MTVASRCADASQDDKASSQTCAGVGEMSVPMKIRIYVIFRHVSGAYKSSLSTSGMRDKFR